jgi:hypothetical protein
MAATSSTPAHRIPLVMIESAAARTATGAEATLAAAVTLVSDAAAMPAATQSAADGGPVGGDESAAIAMQ